MKFSDSTVAFLIFSTALAIFILTLCPTVSLSDSGELAASCASLGIAHPTGYPLYTIIGNVFVRILFFAPPVFATNFMSALFAAAATAIIFIFIRKCGISIFTAAMAAIMFPVGKIVWNEAVVTEVYALSAFIQWSALLTLWLWLKDGKPRWLCISGYIWGLSFAHHMSTVLFIPALLLIIFRGRKNLTVRLALCALGLFMLALTAYLYLPIRSSLNPAFNWGAPSSMQRLWKHLSGWQYRVWMFSQTGAQLIANLKNMLSIITRNTGIPGIALSILGLMVMFIKRDFHITRSASSTGKGARKNEICNTDGIILPISLALICTFATIYALNYSIPDISPYYIPVAGALAVAAAGIENILPRRKWLAGIVITSVVIFAAASNFAATNRSEDYSAREYGENILFAPPPNSLLLIGSWDLYAPAMYLQKCENIAQSLTLVDFALLRRSWYVEELIALDDFSGATAAADNFLKIVAPFERGDKYNPNVIQSSYEQMIYAIITTRSAPVYAFVTQDFFTRRYSGIPEGLMFRIDDGAIYRAFPPTLLETSAAIACRKHWSSRQRTVYNLYPRMFVSRAGYLHTIGKLAECESNLISALRFDAENRNIIENLLTVRIERKKYSEALRTLESLKPYLPQGGAEIIRRDIIDKIAAENDS